MFVDCIIYAVFRQHLQHVSDAKKISIFLKIQVLKTSNKVKTAFTRHALQQFGVTHLTLPDVCEDVLHSFSPPQEVKDTQVMAHTLTGEHLKSIVIRD